VGKGIEGAHGGRGKKRMGQMGQTGILTDTHGRVFLRALEKE